MRTKKRKKNFNQSSQHKRKTFKLNQEATAKTPSKYCSIKKALQTCKCIFILQITFDNDNLKIQIM